MLQLSGFYCTSDNIEEGRLAPWTRRAKPGAAVQCVRKALQNPMRYYKDCLQGFHA